MVVGLRLHLAEAVGAGDERHQQPRLASAGAARRPARAARAAGTCRSGSRSGRRAGGRRNPAAPRSPARGARASRRSRRWPSPTIISRNARRNASVAALDDQHEDRRRADEAERRVGVREPGDTSSRASALRLPSAPSAAACTRFVGVDVPEAARGGSQRAVSRDTTGSGDQRRPAPPASCRGTASRRPASYQLAGVPGSTAGEQLGIRNRRRDPEQRLAAAEPQHQRQRERRDRPDPVGLPVEQRERPAAGTAARTPGRS